MLDELGDEELLRLRDEKGAVRVFKEHRESIIDGFKEEDPEYWARFVESQEKARANVKVAQPKPPGVVGGGDQGAAQAGESAVAGENEQSAATD